MHPKGGRGGTRLRRHTARPGPARAKPPHPPAVSYTYARKASGCCIIWPLCMLSPCSHVYVCRLCSACVRVLQNQDQLLAAALRRAAAMPAADSSVSAGTLFGGASGDGGGTTTPAGVTAHFGAFSFLTNAAAASARSGKNPSTRGSRPSIPLPAGMGPMLGANGSWDAVGTDYRALLAATSSAKGPSTLGVERSALRVSGRRAGWCQQRPSSCADWSAANLTLNSREYTAAPAGWPSLEMAHCGPPLSAGGLVPAAAAGLAHAACAWWWMRSHMQARQNGVEPVINPAGPCACVLAAEEREHGHRLSSEGRQSRQRRRAAGPAGGCRRRQAHVRCVWGCFDGEGFVGGNGTNTDCFCLPQACRPKHAVQCMQTKARRPGSRWRNSCRHAAWACCIDMLPDQFNLPLPLPRRAGNKSQAKCARVAVRVLEASALTHKGTHMAGAAGMRTHVAQPGDAALDPFAVVSCERASQTTKPVLKASAGQWLGRLCGGGGALLHVLTAGPAYLLRPVLRLHGL